MTGPRIRGWCPTLDRPMLSGDGWLARVKPPLARLAPRGARALASAAARYGNGVIELTQRGNLQVRGLTEASAPAFAEAVRDAGLALSPAQEARRAVIPPPLLHDDPTIAPDAAALLTRLEHACQTDPRLAALPAKFAIYVEAGGILAGRPVAADLVAWTDGRAVGLRRAARGPAPPPVGLLRYPGTDAAAFGLAPPFGQMDADLLRAAAELAEGRGTALRVTPWRTLLLGRIDRADPPRKLEAWITDPADPRLLITACIGAPGCGSATVPTRAVAAHMRPTALVHIAGCSKGCAHPGPAPLTLVGNQGRWDIVHNGTARDQPVATGLMLDQVLAHP